MENKNNEFIRAKPLGEYVKKYLDCPRGPFEQRNAIPDILRDLAVKIYTMLEQRTGRQIYVKDDPTALNNVPERFYSMIRRLTQEDILYGLKIPKAMAGWPEIPALLAHGIVMAAGYDLNWDSACVKAFAEFLERHASINYGSQKFVLGSWNHLKKDGAVSPQRFSCFSKQQLNLPEYAENRISEESAFSWAKCRTLIGEKKCLVPAQLVYSGYKRLPGESLIRQNTSSGAAAGTSWDMAVYNGIAELFERDAFLVHWLNKISPPQIEPAFLDEETKKIALLYKKFNIDFGIFDITTDIEMPVALVAVKTDAEGYPSVFVSPRADLDFQSAVKYALIDGLRAGYWEPFLDKNLAKPQIIKNLDGRRKYWSYPDTVQKANFLFKGKETTRRENKFSGATYKTKLKELKNIIQKNNLDVYVADITTPIANEFGLYVVMTLIPELLPLYLDERFRFLGTERLYNSPLRIKKLIRPRKEEEINKVPHPFL